LFAKESSGPNAVIDNGILKPTKAGVVVLRRFNGAWHCLLLRAYRNWDFPKGEIDAGEMPLAAARREVAEETTLTALAFRWGDIFRDTEPYGSGKVARYYLAESPDGDVALPVSAELGRPEHHEFRWVGFQAARRLVPPRLQAVVAWAEKTVAASDS
jgi:bis(5'-nucleosidyl)-tetraphosphatase